MTTASSKVNYKKTLNLPKTSFPMKANLVQNEPASFKRWQKAGLYDALQTERAGAERFVFHDGPPYTSGSIHIGHLLNKCLKDFVVRSKLMQGMACPFVPGWDCHGLPIEHRVMTELAESGKLAKLQSLEDGPYRMAIRRECAKYATKHQKQQRTEMERLLTLADYEHPYLTMQPEYEGATIEVFARLVEEGLVYRQLKAVHWSTENHTALADAELEYHDREDLSVFVDFEVADAAALYEAFGLGDDDRPAQGACLMIWTTTPWTLPANLAVAVNAKFDYALVRVDGNVTVLAEALVEKVTSMAGADKVEVLATTKGSSLLGLAYRNPLIDGQPNFEDLPDAAMRHADPSTVYHVVEADYVTLEDGTGLVHTAPGHGADDYQTGLREKLPIYCPVREDGTYDDSVPEHLRGKSVWDANAEIAEELRESGHLFYDRKFMHSYPHDWRGKSPVIFRATEQWFISVDAPRSSDGANLRQLALDETEERVRFIPQWGRNRLRGMLDSRPDWCISRQRSWGLPIPAFHTPDGEVLLTPASVRAVSRSFSERGSDAWFLESPADLLRHYDVAADPDAPKDLDVTTLTKGFDIFDVWFESGSSWFSVMMQRSPAQNGGDEAVKDFPVDLYLEGSDQHRGWFQLSLLPGLGVMGQSPFTTVLTHGFMVDKNGHKMSKSIGNALNVADLMKDFGADVCRWWVSSISYEGDIKADLDFIKTAGEAYRKVRNTLRFMLSNLNDFEPSPPGSDCTSGQGMCVPLSSYDPTSIDAWVLGEYNAMAKDVIDAYNSYAFQRASSRLYNFCNDTLSAVYLAAVKDRLYCDAPDSARRRQTQSTMWDLVDGLARLLAPIMPHTADEAHRALTGADESCVHMKTFIDRFDVTVDDRWPALMTLRDEALRALENVRSSTELDNPIDAGLLLPNQEGVLDGFDVVDLADLHGVSRVAAAGPDASIEVQDLREEARCERSWKRDGTVRARSDGGMLSDRDAEAVGVS